MIKDILVHLDGTVDDELRIAHAETLSRDFGDARMTGLFTSFLPEYAYNLSGVYGMTDAGVLAELEERLRQEAQAAEIRLRERVTRAAAATEVRRLEAYPSQMSGLVAKQARWSDLLVATTPYRATGSTWDRVVEAALFDGGRPLYLVPPSVAPRPKATNVLVAWQNTLETARAAQSALPLLRQASLVRLLVVDAGREGVLGGDVDAAALYLTRHGVKVEIEAKTSTDDRVADAILTAAERFSADAIVMGAYGHSRFREWIIGGVTRDVIESTRHPLWLAH